MQNIEDLEKPRMQKMYASGRNMKTTDVLCGKCNLRGIESNRKAWSRLQAQGRFPASALYCFWVMTQPGCALLQVMVFFTTARLTGMYAELFDKMGMPVLELHSRKSQPQR